MLSKPRLRRLLCPNPFQIWPRGCSPAIHHHGLLTQHPRTGHLWAQRLGSSLIRVLTIVDVIGIVSVIGIEVDLTDVISKKGVVVGSANPEVVVVTSDETTDGLIITVKKGDEEGIRGQTSAMDVVGHVPQNGTESLNLSVNLKRSQNGNPGRQLR